MIDMLMNKVYCEDNHLFLKKIDDCSIDLIYNDILYNTGRDFIEYKDRFNSIYDALSWYEPRFYEMKRVLKDTGLLYIQCDYNLSHYIKILLDKIFGVKNFRNEIIWWYNSAPRKKKDFGKRHNVIFRYSKTDNYYFNENSIYIREPYSKTAPRGYEKEKYYDPRGKIIDDVWKINMIGQNDKTERVGYPTQKPEELLYKIIDSSCPKDGVVADFFCGSGTTLAVAKKLGIKYIGCDNNKNAVDISIKRIGLIEGYKDSFV